MKRASAIILAVICCLIMPLSAFADDIYIIEDGEDEFIPAETTTVKQEETTTAASSSSSGGGLNLDMGSISDYLGSITDSFGGGIDSIISGFEGFDFNFGNTAETTTSQLSDIKPEDYTQANQAGSMTTYPDNANKPDSPAGTTVIQNVQQTETTTTTVIVEEELPSVLIVGAASDDDWGLSGSTLTMLVFILAVIILILVIIIVLVIMTRKTEFNSIVKQKSTLHSVDRPSTLAQFIEDDMPSDGKDYSDIAYWNK